MIFATAGRLLLVTACRVPRKRGGHCSMTCFFFRVINRIMAGKAPRDWRYNAEDAQGYLVVERSPSAKRSSAQQTCFVFHDCAGLISSRAFCSAKLVPRGVSPAYRKIFRTDGSCSVDESSINIHSCVPGRPRRSGVLSDSEKKIPVAS